LALARFDKTNPDPPHHSPCVPTGPPSAISLVAGLPRSTAAPRDRGFLVLPAVAVGGALGGSFRKPSGRSMTSSEPDL
jgi:hypothetical protein